MKKLVRCLMLMLILPVAFVFTGCVGDDVVSIKSIDRTGGNDLVNEYTITYTNGKTDKFTILNGEDGESLYNNITVNDLYEQVKTSKPEGYTLIQFIDEYLDIQLDAGAVASATALRSAVSIFVEHEVTIPDYNNPTGYNPFSGYTYGVKSSIAWGAGAGVIYNLDTTTGDAYIITNYHVCFSTGTLAEDGIAKRFTIYAYGAETIDTADLYYLGYYNDDCKTYADKFEYDINGLPIIDYGYGAIEAEYVGGSEKYDIAVLKVAGSDRLKDSDYLAVETYDSNLVTAGSTAIAVGNPDACGISVTDGVISVDSEYIAVKISDEAVVLREFRIDTPVNSGNSGGGLFDNYGRLIGIVNAKTPDDTIENMSYAIPSNIATRVADSIIDNCDGIDRKTTRVMFGITLETVNSNATYDEGNGVMRISEEVAISTVEEDSLADSIGLKPGDIITEVKIIRDDEVVFKVEGDRIFKVIDAMLLVRVGDSVVFSYTRGENSSTIATPILTADNFIDIE